MQDLPDSSPDLPHTPRRFEWLALVALFLLAGVIGHDPWKQDETYSFGIIYHFYTTHSWLIPTNAGQPFMEKPPLYYWTAVLFCDVLAPLLPLHDAARLTSLFYMVIALGFMWKSSRLLFENHPQRDTLSFMAVTLLLGTMGVVRHSHDMFTDVALLAGSAVALNGLILLVRSGWEKGGFLFGLGIGIQFLSKGLFTPVVFGVSALALLFFFPALPKKSLLKSAVISLVAAAPFLFIWPGLLYHASPPLFKEWFWDNNVGRFLGFTVGRLGAGNEQHYFLQAIIWFAFPTFLLALAGLMGARKQWFSPQYLLPLVIVITGMGLLLVSASGRALYLLPILPALALLAALGIGYISAQARWAWNRISQFLFGAAIMGLWLVWWTLSQPANARTFPNIAQLVGEWLPLEFVPEPQRFWACALAALITGIWLASLRFKALSPRHTAYIWLANIAGVWGVAMTLLLPWINETKSYQPVLRSMYRFVKQSPYENECIGNYILGESIPPMLHYYDANHRIAPLQDFQHYSCRLMLMDVRDTAPKDVAPHWNMIWSGTRVLDSKHMELRLYAVDK